MILAVDPGKATGWAMWGDDVGVMETGIDEQMAFCDMVMQTAWRAHDVIVCESYIITPGTSKVTFQPASLEIIGFLRWHAHHEHVGFVLQPPSAKRFMPDSKLRSLGWFVRGSDGGHDNDALRHLGVYLAEKERNEEVLRAV